MKKIISLITSIIISVCFLNIIIPGLHIRAAEAYDGEMVVYISLTASGTDAGDRGLVYQGPESEENTPEIISVTSTAAVGDTVTVSLTLPEEITRIYDIAPVLYSAGDNVAFSNVDASVSLKVNGEEKEIISEADQVPSLSWKDEKAEKQTAWRLYGGIEEGGFKYSDPDAFKGATEIEYTITINSVDAYGPAYEGEALVFIGFDGDLSESGDHGLIYNGPYDQGNCGDITTVNAEIRCGETVTVSLTLPKALHHAYVVTPVIIPLEEGAEFSFIDAAVSLKIDGSSTDTGSVPDVTAWPGAIGSSNAWQIYGGAYEDGTGSIGTDLFAGATTIEYTITLNSVYEVPRLPEPEPEIIPEEELDPIVQEDDLIYLQPEEVIETEIPDDKYSDNGKGLVIGILLSVIAIVFIICGTVLSKQKPVTEEEKPDRDGDDDVIDLDELMDELGEETDDEEAPADKEKTESAEEPGDKNKTESADGKEGKESEKG